MCSKLRSYACYRIKMPAWPTESALNNMRAAILFKPPAHFRLNTSKSYAILPIDRAPGCHTNSRIVNFTPRRFCNTASAFLNIAADCGAAGRVSRPRLSASAPILVESAAKGGFEDAAVQSGAREVIRYSRIDEPVEFCSAFLLCPTLT